MRIAIDARAYSWAGVGRYTRNLLWWLRQTNRENEYIVLLSKEDLPRFTSDLALYFPSPVAWQNRFQVKVVDSSYYSWREQTVFLRQLHAVKADLFHFTHFNVPLLFRRPYVVTIHDITRFVFPGEKHQGLFQQMAYEIVFRHAVQEAAAVICVSETTKEALRSLPFVLPRQVQTIYEGVENVFFESVKLTERAKARMLLGIRDPYLLYVGVWMSHKNLRRVLAAFRIMRRRHPRLKLVLTGKPKPGYVNAVSLARRFGVEKSIVFPGFVTHNLLPALYTEAACLLFPSLYEGFGLPALEAMACGTPVVASRVGSLPEILGEAAEYVNPEYLPGIVAGIERVLGDRNLREMRVREGRKRAVEYRWETAAIRHAAVYQNAISALE